MREHPILMMTESVKGILEKRKGQTRRLNNLAVRCFDGKDAAAYLFWNYEPNPDWVELISILENDSFAEMEDSHG